MRAPRMDATSDHVMLNCNRLTLTILLATSAVEAAPEGTSPRSQVQPLLRRLQGNDPSERRVAAVLLKNLPGEEYDAVKKASERGDLSPAARAAVQAALPDVKARARRLERD